MAKKDKFAQLHAQGGGMLGSVGSFQNLAATVAAIDQQEQQEEKENAHTEKATPSAPRTKEKKPAESAAEEERFMRLPNPKIPLTEYNLVSNYCNSLPNMTRQDFVELAILEKLYKDCGLPKAQFDKRYKEIRNRPPRGHRKGTKQLSK